MTGPELETIIANERCRECGLELEQTHASCQGHQTCYPECPRCGGDLEAIR